jgi:tRNA(fMet)-specific endonuclease VapC
MRTRAILPTPLHASQNCVRGAVYVTYIDFADDAALHYAEIRADLKKRGALIGANDLLIAAHARALDLRLVTNNTAEFERVRSLKIENWTTPPRRKR